MKKLQWLTLLLPILLIVMAISSLFGVYQKFGKTLINVPNNNDEIIFQAYDYTSGQQVIYGVSRNSDYKVEEFKTNRDNLSMYNTTVSYDSSGKIQLNDKLQLSEYIKYVGNFQPISNGMNPKQYMYNREKKQITINEYFVQNPLLPNINEVPAVSSKEKGLEKATVIGSSIELEFLSEKPMLVHIGKMIDKEYYFTTNGTLNSMYKITEKGEIINVENDQKTKNLVKSCGLKQSLELLNPEYIINANSCYKIELSDKNKELTIKNVKTNKVVLKETGVWLNEEDDLAKTQIPNKDGLVDNVGPNFDIIYDQADQLLGIYKINEDKVSLYDVKKEFKKIDDVPINVNLIEGDTVNIFDLNDPNK
ncbi:MAG: hypothetical protein ACRCUP_04065 [Mycoplasmatales bacterium]